MMKICEHCGNENIDETKYCVNCGNNLQNTQSVQPESNINENTENTSQQTNNYQETYQQPNNQQTDYQQNYNNPNTYQQSNYQFNQQVTSQKITWLAPLINLIAGILIYLLCGIGHFYLNLYKRGIALCVAGIIPIIINLIFSLLVNNFVGSLLSLIVGIILVLYSAYDAYICAKAINEGSSLPLLFGQLDIQ